MNSKPVDTPPDDETRHTLAEFVRSHRAAKLPVLANGTFLLPNRFFVAFAVLTLAQCAFKAAMGLAMPANAFWRTTAS